MKAKIDFVRSLFAKDVNYPQLSLISDLKEKFGQGLAFPAIARLRDAYKSGKFDEAATEVFTQMEKRKAELESKNAEPKRGPGRPPKAKAPEAAAAAAPVKRGPGRPPKAKAPEAAAAAAPVKRGPGRPPKAKAPEAAAAPAPVKRGPGRPPKNPVAAAAPAAAAAAPVKRGPGRPPKAAASAAAAVLNIIKRGPGRPPKNPVAATPAPAAAAPAPAPVVAKPAPAPAPAASAAPAPEKRGSGRPALSALIAAAKTVAAAPVVKRGPGRPRKDAAAPVEPVKDRGDRRKKGVALKRGRRKADKLLVLFDSVPNHLVLAFRDGGVEDFRFKAKDDAKKCIQNLMGEGLAASRIAYYNRQDYGLEVNVRL